MISALLLTAGLGTRLDPVTRLVAKPAAPLGDRTLVEHVIGWLAGQGVHDAVVNLHHLPATIAGVLGDGSHLDLRLRYSWEPSVLGSAGGPRRALPLLGSDPFLIVNGDTICTFDLASMIEAHHASGADVTMAVVPNPLPAHYNGIQADDDGVVTRFIPRGHSVPSWHFVGVQVVRRRVFEGLEDGVAMETVAGIYRALIETRPGSVRTWEARSRFLDIGTPRDYLAAALAQPPDSWREVTIAPSARVTRSALWPGTTIDARAALADCIVAGVHVPAGLDARNAVLIPASYVRPGERVQVHGDIAAFPIA